jgi:hypothetical protein
MEARREKDFEFYFLPGMEVRREKNFEFYFLPEEKKKHNDVKSCFVH